MIISLKRPFVFLQLVLPMLVTVMLTSSRLQRGVTLVELVITIAVLSISLTVMTIALNESISRSSDTLLELRAVALAQAYLDEALGKRFDENSANNGIPPCRAPGTGGVPTSRQCTDDSGGSWWVDGTEIRRRYDDVDDYNAIDEGAGVASPNDTLKDADGNARTGYDGFRVTMNVRYIDVGGGGTESGLGQNNELDDKWDGKLITVTVSHTALPSDMVFAAYKSNF